MQLLQPLPLATAIARNRVMFGPHVTNLGDDQRCFTPRHTAYYERRARGGCGIIVTDSAIQFRAEAFHGEVLVIEMSPADFNKYGFDLVYRVSEQSSSREVARGKIGIMCFDYAAKKPMALPAAFLGRFAA